MSNTLYNEDFYAWANEQARLLRVGNLSAADIEHIAEEIESMGRSEKRELVNRLAVLLTHLLKWQFQPERRGNSWRNIIEGQRIRLSSHMRDNPSLKSALNDAITEAFRLARLDAETETGIDKCTFPAECPWTFGQIMNEGFWPDQVLP
jgi:hypothetical protein